MTREDKIFKQLESGDTDCLNELIKLYYQDILRYCRWHVPNRSLAEDATQETFLKAIKYFERYVHKGKFKSFLYKIAANTCVDMRRGKRAESEIPKELTADENGFNKVEAELNFKVLIGKLPEETRELVILRYAFDLTIREVAEAAGLPMRTVQSRLRAALKQIKKDIQEGGIR